MSVASTTLETIGDLISDALSRLSAAWGSPDDIAAFVSSIGWNLPSVPQVLQDLGTSLQAVVSARAALLTAQAELDEGSGTEDGVLSALAEVLAQVSLVAADFQGLPDALRSQLPASFVTATGIADALQMRLLDEVVIETIDDRSPGLKAVAVLLGWIEETSITADPTIFQPDFLLRVVQWSRVPTLFSSPKQLFTDVYGWGTPTLNVDRLFDAIDGLSRIFGSPAVVDYPTSAFLDAIVPGSGDTTTGPDPMLIMTLASAGGAAADLAVLGAPVVAGQAQGLAFRLLLDAAANQDFALSPSLTLSLHASATVNSGVGAVLNPAGPSTIVIDPETSPSALATGKIAAQLLFAQPQPNDPLRLLSIPSGSVLQVDKITFELGAQRTGTAAELFVDVSFSGGKLVLSTADADGFLAKLLPPSGVTFAFDLGIGWSETKGVTFSGSGGLSFVLPLSVSIGPVTIDAISVALVVDTGLQLGLGANIAAALGPVSVTVQGLGIGVVTKFQPGNVGPVDVALATKLPTGVGVAIDAGPVSGGGFISFDPPNSRYFGALELQVYGIGVKAFGIIETKFPDGHKGYSFLIIISAEFTPIQLGLGFTLNGVGGLVGINRTLDTNGLLTAVRQGYLDNVLFPHDVVDDAPTILSDLESIFPPADGHYAFGPMAKIGWGTPTLVDAEIGIVIELPGPRLAVLGTVHAALPTSDAAIVVINLDVAGVLDFPKQTFALDASMHDSFVGPFTMSGDMSMRLAWGQNPNFALAIGGFNPHYTPPAGFPTLRPISVDLGVHGNPSISLKGYMAVTSNTAQVGAQLEARASKGGASLYGFLGFDALFVFSPFSFEADIEGGVGVSFHGANLSLHFHGMITGPTPWHINGQVCVSVIFWDACVGFSLTLGGTTQATLPGLDPWLGSTIKADGTQDVPGLQPALQNSANWGGGAPTGSFPVVTLVAPASGAPTPIDPLGSATVRQKAVPLDLAITRFAGTKPSVNRTFDVPSVTIGQGLAANLTLPSGSTNPAVVTVTKPPPVPDFFAPGQFQAMKDADKLSSPSFVQLNAGFTISSNAVTFGTSVPVGLTYDTFVFNTDGTETELDGSYNPSQAHVTAVTGRSAAALLGIRGSASAHFVDPTALPKVTFTNPGYVLSLISSLKVTTDFPLTAAVSRPIAQSALLAAATTLPNAFQTLQVTPSYLART